MRKLHLVGVTSDLTGLIFSGRRGSRSGGYLVSIEEELIDAIADARSGSDGEDVARIEAAARPGRDRERKRSRPESTLTPREMQDRLRAGRSIAEVAVEARVDAEWVERFAVPILAEQAKIVELAQSLKFSKPRLGESVAPLGKSVALNLAERGVVLPQDVFDAGWSAYQLHGSVWVVRFRYRSRGRFQEAAWELDSEAGTAGHRNRLGSELGYVEGARRRRARGQGASDEPGSQEAGAASAEAPDKTPAGRAPSPPARKRSASRGSQRPPRAAPRSARTSAAKAPGRVASRAPAKRAGAASAPKRDAAARAGKAGGAATGRAKARRTSTSPPRAPAKSGSPGKAAAKSAQQPAKRPGASAPAANRTARTRPPAAKSNAPAAKAQAPAAKVQPTSAPVRARRPVISAQPVSQLVRPAG